MLESGFRESEMLFGNSDLFAIEVSNPGLIETRWHVSLNFWIDNEPIGDMREKISLVSSIANLRDFLQFKSDRFSPEFQGVSSEQIFYDLYTRYYEANSQPDVASQNLRRRFHIDDIGMSSIVDKYGIILVALSDKTARLIWKKWSDENSTYDFSLPFGEVERVGKIYEVWSESYIGKLNS
jgi:hypothetical protein